MRTFAGAISAPRLPRTEVVVVQSFSGLFCGARLNAGSGRDVSVRPLAFLNRDCFDRLMATPPTGDIPPQAPADDHHQSGTVAGLSPATKG